MTIANPKILIVEDDSFMLSLLTSLFQSNGYDVAGVDKHSDALVTAKSFNPDVILLDIHLDDGYTGYNIADDLKSSELSEIPTVFLTGEKDDTLRCKAFMCGGLDFLRKPFDKTDLLNRVKPLAMIGRMRKTLNKINKE
jgi:DNA-binding response OmpR family regulator